VKLQSCEKAMGWCTAQCKMPLSRSFELAHLKKKKKKETKIKNFGRLVSFWFSTFLMLFYASGHVVHHENT